MYDIIEQYRLRDLFLKERLDTLLPAVMKETGTEFWLIICREYHEDPMFRHIVPAHYPTARRLTILIFAMEGEEVRRISLSMPDSALDQFYKNEWDRKNETQFEALTRIIRRFDPEKITVNISDHHYAYTDGLSHGLYLQLKEELPEDITARFISSDEAGIRLLETRTESELAYWPHVMETAGTIIEEAFSDQVITPGVTTCRDVMDFMTKRVNELGITTWFEPTIDLQNETGMHGEETVIQRGDLLHCDFGIVYLNLCTDTQRLCYVLKEGETEVPEELQKAIKRNNRFQDIVCEHMKAGRTGNEVFLSAVEHGKKEGLRPMLYTHPLGLFGHACGPTIGLWTDQNPIYPAGENLVNDRTGYALEGNTTEYLEMYRRDTFIFTEESVVVKDGSVHFLQEGREWIRKVG